MAGTRSIAATFGAGERLIATLLDDVAPVTCAAVWDLAGRQVELQIRHVIFTGRELGMHVPEEIAESIPEFEARPLENQSVFPAPGDIMFQYCPPYQFAGDPSAVYDISICYGPDTRLFMPWGWSPANRFASVRYADRDLLAAVGRRMVSSRSDTLVFSQVLERDHGMVDVGGQQELDVREIEPGRRHSAIFEAYHSLPADADLVLVNDHDPKSLRYHFAAEYAGSHAWEYLESGPLVWRIKITKT
jgi:uncharacterized protein (DUF2249 family)